MAEKKDKKDVNEQNIGMAAIAYILFFVPLLTDAKDDQFVKYHVRQGFALFLFVVVVVFIGGMIPLLGWFIIAPLGSLISLILAVIGIVNAVNGKKEPLPMIGQYGENFKF